MRTYTFSSVAVLLAATKVSAFWRQQCYQPVVVDRVDPIVQPGVLPARHIHNVMGASGFTADATFESLQKSDCTSCRVKGDNSVYWVPSFYFKRADTGEFVMVNQKADMLVYYLPERGAQEGIKIEAFPPGFQMIAGDPTRRNFTEGIQPTEESRRQQAIGFNCLNYAGTPEGFAQRRMLPSKDEMKNCVNGLRADIAFPSCWNGKLDSPDHRAHVAYPDNVEDGQCPEGYNRRLVSILYETLFDVAPFNDIDGEFVWANGDPTGYGYHGDFLAGWSPGLLESAMADPTCVPPVITATGGVIENCMTFVNGGRLQTDDEMGACSIKQVTTGDYSGPMPNLTGCNSISYGPEPAPECSDDDPIGEETGGFHAGSAAPAAHAPASSSAAPAPAPAASQSSASVLGANFFNHVSSAIAAAASKPSPVPAAAAPPAAAAVVAPADGEDVVVVVETITQTFTTTALAKRTAAPQDIHKRHAHAEAHRRRRWF